MQRMKENYEIRSRGYLTRRTPVILRVDGKAFHTYTRGLNKPFDEYLMYDMIETTKYLCSKIQGAKCGYVQSDEISILLTDYDNLQTSAWFDYEVQKMCSIAASQAASYFMKMRLLGMSQNYQSKTIPVEEIDEMRLADFDCRAFNIPKEEVTNYFLARQKDAVKNSISMLAQSLYPHKQLHGKNTNQMQEMCFQKGINWNDLHYSKKRGTFVVRDYFINSEGMNRSKWETTETPMTFTENDFKQWL